MCSSELRPPGGAIDSGLAKAEMQFTIFSTLYSAFACLCDFILGAVAAVELLKGTVRFFPLVPGKVFHNADLIEECFRRFGRDRMES